MAHNTDPAAVIAGLRIPNECKRVQTRPNLIDDHASTSQSTASGFQGLFQPSFEHWSCLGNLTQCDCQTTFSKLIVTQILS